ncbi:hypothetical protein B0F90DRAFT_1916642 [Multifurca ochricompacta]|uniref:Uncharacterized protein n=1 Tax=Multifurca ochricompacta TaxID=376703 RepID=A0AAD4QMC3_9AGAM|nr:hypothetical protein B0F90DRAFT_1916642 [Multifurca ochricompacta]
MVHTDTFHRYNLVSRGKDYALVIIQSRAANPEDTPLLYFGEEVTGFIVLSQADLSNMRIIEIALQTFNSDPIIPSYETKLTLSSQQVESDSSNISGGKYHWPFSITPPAAAASGQSDSSLGHHSSHSQSGGQNFQFLVTIYRRNRLTRNVAVTQPISYVSPPDSSTSSSSSHIIVEPPSDLSVNESWIPQKFPPVLVKGLMFRQVHVEVECRLVVPTSYPVSDIIPLRLIMTSESREALDLVTISDVINVRLLKLITFGEQASAAAGPMSLVNRGSYHRKDWAARAHWEVDGHTKELPPTKERPQIRWRIKLNGKLQRDRRVDMCSSMEKPGMAIMYFVCLFPFRATGFRPQAIRKRSFSWAKLHSPDSAEIPFSMLHLRYSLDISLIIIKRPGTPIPATYAINYISWTYLFGLFIEIGFFF